MFTKFIPFFVVLSVIAVSGCMNQSSDAVRPKPYLLGQEFSTFEPPRRSPTTIQYAPEVAEPNGVVTLREVLALALMYNPQLRAFSWEVRALEARKLQAGLLPNPELEIEVEEVGGTGQRRSFDGAQTTLQLSQLIELKGKRRKRIQMASLEKELAQWDYQAKRLDVLTKTTRFFVGVLAAQRRLILAEELVRLSEQVLTTVSQRVEAGKDSPVEKTKAEIALTSVRIEWKKARGNLESVRKQLAAIWAGKTANFERVAGRLEVVSPIPTADELTDLIIQNPDIARWSVEVQRRQAAVELEKARVASDLTLSGGLRQFNETDDTAVVFGVSIPLPIFNNNQGGIREAGHRLAKATEERKAAEANARIALAVSYQALSNAFTEATELKNKVLDGAQSVFDASTEGYREGKLDYLNVLDAQRTLFEAKGKYIEALAAYHKARADVERLIAQGIDTVKTIQK